MQYPKALRWSAAFLLASISAEMSAAELKYRVDMFITEQRRGGFLLDSLHDLNNRGEVIGVDYSRAPGEESFMWSGGKFTSLQVDGRRLWPYRINDQGQVAGETPLGTYIHDRGRAVNINPASDPSRTWRVTGFNNAGQAVGDHVSEREPEQYFYDGRTTRAMNISGQLGAPREYIDVIDLNERGVVLGSYYSSSLDKQVPFTWQDGVATPLALPSGTRDLSVTDLNDAGHVAGSIRQDPIGMRPVLIRDGRVVDLMGTATGDGETAGLNNQDWAVGGMRDAPDSTYNAFLYRDGRMFNVNELLVARDARRWTFGVAYEINDRGQFLVNGTARDDSGLSVRALLTPVPEPQSAALLLAGLALVAAVARRTREPAARP